MNRSANRRRSILPSGMSDADAMRTGRIFHMALFGLTLTTFYALTWQLILPDFLDWMIWITIPAALLYLTVIVLLRRGRIQTATALYFAGTWLLLTVVAAMSGGTRAPFFGMYTLLVVLAILVGHWRIATVGGGMALIAGLIMAHLNNLGILPPPFATPLSAWVTQASQMIMLVYTGYLVVHDLNLNVERLREELAERQRTEAALRESQERYRTLVENFPDVILVQTLDGTVVHMNRAAEQQIGLTVTETNQPGHSALIHPDDAQRVTDAVHDLLKSDKTSTDLIENRFIDRNGTLHWYSGVITKTTWNGQPALQTVTRDITTAKLAEASLRESEAKFRTIFELAPYGIIIQQRGGVLVAANQAFLDETGFRLEQVENQNILDSSRFGLFQSDNVLGMMRQMAATGRISNQEMQLYRADGRPLTMLISSQEVQLAGASHIVTIGVDITERKQAEAEARALNGELIQKAAQLAALNELARDISTLSDLQATLRQALPKLQTILPADALFIALYDPATDTVTYPVMYDAGQFWDEPPSRLSRPTILANVIESGTTLMLNRTEAEIEAHKNLETRLGDSSRVSASLLMAPLALGGQVIGAISAQSYTPNAYNQTHYDLLLAAAYQIAVAVENARLYGSLRGELAVRQQAEREIRQLNADLEQKASYLATINEIAREVSALTDLNSTLRRTLKKLKSALPLDVFYVGLYDSFTQLVRFPFLYDMENFWEQPPVLLFRTEMAESVIRTGQPVFLNRSEAVIREKSESAEAQMKRVGNTRRVSASVLMAPLSLGGNTIGVISVQSYTLNAYQAKHIDLLMGVAYQVAVAVDNANLYDSLRQELLVRQQAEQALFQLNTELEQRVAQRTALLEATNHELEAFSYSVSHDLRAPLRSVDGFGQALLEDYESVLDETGRNYLHRIRTAAQRMGGMIDALLTLSRITRAQLNLQPVDLSTMVDEILATLREGQPTHQVDVRVKAGIFGLCDSRLIQVALQNLLENAWKYTARQPNPVIEFGCRTIENELVYHIADNGVGFDMKHAPKLFTAFQRLHSEQDFQGTGIGLATVQRVIHRHGGRIWAEGRVSQGATFFFTLGSGALDS